jgi:hypothetical protein
MSLWGHAAPWTTPGVTGEVRGSALRSSMGILALSLWDKDVPTENPNGEILLFARQSQLLSHDVHLKIESGTREVPFQVMGMSDKSGSRVELKKEHQQ